MFHQFKLLKNWNALYTTYTREGMGLAWTSDFGMDTEVDILCLQAAQCLNLHLTNQSML